MESDESVQENEKLEIDPPPTVTLNIESKAIRIQDAIAAAELDTLRELAASEGGLLSDELRRQGLYYLAATIVETQNRDVRAGSLFLNIEMRTRFDWTWTGLSYIIPMVRLHECTREPAPSNTSSATDQSSNELDQRKLELSELITEVLRRHSYLCYFQGYHDICQVFLLVLDYPSRVEAVARLSVLRIRDFMLPTLAPALSQLRLIPDILFTVDPSLCNHLSQTQPFFALSGTLTMYAHDIQEYGDIARLFDVLLAREAVFSVYMFAQIVLQRADELFETPADEPEMLHSILSKLPHPLDVESLINKSIALFEVYPPERLRSWRSISRSSVLKTARWPAQTKTQTLEDGEGYFHKHVKEIRWAEQREKAIKAIWYYRRPARAIGFAVLVGVLSYWLRRSGGPSGYLGTGNLWRYWKGYRGH